MSIQPESILGLPEPWRSRVPALTWRMGLTVGSTAKLIVLLNGAVHEFPWVEIEEVTGPGRYVGRVNAAGWEPAIPVIAFTSDNILACVPDA
jgi:hypothetical protein